MSETPSVREGEEIPRERLVQLLRGRGPEDPETKELLTRWTMEQERGVETAGGGVDQRIQFEIRRARLYREAGFEEAAQESLEAARVQAWQENRDDLMGAIIEEMEGI